MTNQISTSSVKRFRPSFSLLFAGLILVVAACVRKAPEPPPDTSRYDPMLPVTHSIAQLKSLNGLYSPATGGDTTLIGEDILISGIVVADDRSGNFYKQIVIQDSTGGLFVNIDGYSLFSQFPVGRRVYVRCKGLYLGYNGGTMELGASLTEQLGVTGISGSAIGDHIVKGAVGNVVRDTPVMLSQVRSITAGSANRHLVGRLIAVRDVQFADTGVAYSAPSATSNRLLTDCAGSSATLTVRTSNYADFHSIGVASGRGSISGIYTVYQSASYTPQLLIRDTGDVVMRGERCGSLPTVPTISIDSLRRLYPGTGVFTLPALRFGGTVISDLSKGNVPQSNFVLQDGSRKGIILYLNGGAYNIGDSLLLDASGARIQLYNGAMELTGMQASRVTKVGTSRKVSPVQLTIAQLLAGFAQYESVLVKVVNGSIIGGGTYGGNKTLTDGSGTISLYTSSAATFAATPVPAGSRTFVGIATVYTPNEIKIRDPAIDVY